LFNNARTIENIITRVTGASGSSIDGAIIANGTANLFLINPNGIVFGVGASLNIGGSFLASTARGVVFDNGFEFSATNPQAPPLLTINVPLGLQTGANPGRIVNQSQAPSPIGQPNSAPLSPGLQVQPGRTLALVGGDVFLEGGRLTAAGGRIELGSVTGVGQVSLSQTGNGFVLGYDSINDFGNISLSNGAFVDASGKGGGDIQIRGARLEMRQSSNIWANTLGAENGGEVLVHTTEVELSEGSKLFANVTGTGTGTGGDLRIETGRLLVKGGAQVGAGTFGEGNGGSLLITASESVEVIGISAKGPTGLFTQTRGSGDAGDLTIETGRLLVKGGAQVGPGTLGEGKGGSLLITASESVEVIGTTTTDDGRHFPSGLFTQSEGSGDAGDLTIDTGRLSVRDGAVVSAGTKREGNGGSLQITASDSVELIGTSKDGKFVSALLTESEGSGDAGELRIDTERLLVRNGAKVLAGTEGSGNGGSLQITASDSVELSGRSDAGRSGSGLFTQSQGSGDAGELRIDTRRLLVRDGTQVSVSSRTGQAGNMTITADTLTLNQGRLFAETGKSTAEGGANIRLKDLDLLRMDNESLISANALEDANGGNVTIDSTFIVVTPPKGPEGSDITANAVRGNGGRVSVTTQGLLGIEFRPKPTPNNDITASSEFGIAGEVAINTPDVDPSRGLTNLPTEPVDASNQIAQICPTGEKANQNQFIITGRGGLPEAPDQMLSADAVWTDLRPTPQTAETRSSTQPAKQPTNSQAVPLVEATGWVMNDKGEVVLTASTPTVTPQHPALTPPTCPRESVK
jgi:filamentous hemagglutinin family protein